jgi:hypothetical protein
VDERLWLILCSQLHNDLFVAEMVERALGKSEWTSQKTNTRFKSMCDTALEKVTEERNHLFPVSVYLFLSLSLALALSLALSLTLALSLSLSSRSLALSHSLSCFLSTTQTHQMTEQVNRYAYEYAQLLSEDGLKDHNVPASLLVPGTLQLSDSFAKLSSGQRRRGGRLVV